MLQGRPIGKTFALDITLCGSAQRHVLRPEKPFQVLHRWPFSELHASALCVHVFSHLELVHRHGGAQLLLPRAPARGATVSTASRRCTEGGSEKAGQWEQGGRGACGARHFFQDLGQPYIVRLLPAQVTRGCMRAIILSLT